MRERVTLVPGFVLHSRPYRDSSLLLEIFTRSHGRIGLVARGGRTRSPALLQPLQPLLLSWTQSGELGSFTGAEPQGQRLLLRGEALFAALYCNELLLRLLTRQDAHPELYDDYRMVLERLTTEPISVALRRFEHRLLRALGYGLDSGSLAEGIDVAQPVCFDAVTGLRLARPEESTPQVRFGSLAALVTDTLDEAQARELKPLLRLALETHMTAGRLRTPGVWRALRLLQTEPTV